MQSYRDQQAQEIIYQFRDDNMELRRQQREMAEEMKKLGTKLNRIQSSIHMDHTEGPSISRQSLVPKPRPSSFRGRLSRLSSPSSPLKLEYEAHSGLAIPPIALPPLVGSPHSKKELEDELRSAKAKLAEKDETVARLEQEIKDKHRNHAQSSHPYTPKDDLMHTKFVESANEVRLLREQLSALAAQALVGRCGS